MVRGSEAVGGGAEMSENQTKSNQIRVNQTYGGGEGGAENRMPNAGREMGVKGVQAI